MCALQATCPMCHTADEYGDELAGRYTVCSKCRCRFYVTVPSLNETESAARIGTKPASAATLEDLLLDQQQGERFVIRALHRQEGQLRRILYGIVVIVGLLALNAVLLAVR